MPTDRPSPHLSWEELACKDGTPYPAQWRDTRAVALAGVFEAIRTRCGDLPIKVISAYRTPAHNRTIGGARKSQHLEGRALDLRPPKGMTVGQFYKELHALAATPPIRGLGRYQTFCHVDLRPSPRLVTWRGSGVKDGP